MTGNWQAVQRLLNGRQLEIMKCVLSLTTISGNLGLINGKMVHNFYLTGNSKPRPDRAANCVLITK